MIKKLQEEIRKALSKINSEKLVRAVRESRDEYLLDASALLKLISFPKNI